MDTYCIVRFYFRDYPRKVTRRGLTLEEAQAHCQDLSTQGTDKRKGPWFEGYTREGS